MGHTEQPREHTLSLYPILALASITPSTSRDLGAPLPLSLKLVPPTTSTQVQVIQCLPFYWTYGLLCRNQDKPGVIVFLLHQPYGDRDTQHIY